MKASQTFPGIEIVYFFLKKLRVCTVTCTGIMDVLYVFSCFFVDELSFIVAYSADILTKNSKNGTQFDA